MKYCLSVGCDDIQGHCMIFGNITVVSELLRGGTYRSIDAKNEIGQTAIHLAALLGNTIILKSLIQGGGNVNVKDDADLTPLHVINCKFFIFPFYSLSSLNISMPAYITIQNV